MFPPCIFMLQAFHLPLLLNSPGEFDSCQIPGVHSKRKPQRKNKGKASESGVPSGQSERLLPDKSHFQIFPRVQSVNIWHTVCTFIVNPCKMSFISLCQFQNLAFSWKYKKMWCRGGFCCLFNQFVNFIDHEMVTLWQLDLETDSTGKNVWILLQCFLLVFSD